VRLELLHEPLVFRNDPIVFPNGDGFAVKIVLFALVHQIELAAPGLFGRVFAPDPRRYGNIASITDITAAFVE
jgi:hypothetical protein